MNSYVGAAPLRPDRSARPHAPELRPGVGGMTEACVIDPNSDAVGAACVRIGLAVAAAHGVPLASIARTGGRASARSRATETPAVFGPVALRAARARQARS